VCGNLLTVPELDLDVERIHKRLPSSKASPTRYDALMREEIHCWPRSRVAQHQAQHCPQRARSYGSGEA